MKNLGRQAVFFLFVCVCVYVNRIISNQAGFTTKSEV